MVGAPIGRWGGQVEALAAMGGRAARPCAGRRPAV